MSKPEKKNPVITKDIVAGVLSGFVMGIIAIAQRLTQANYLIQILSMED